MNNDYFFLRRLRMNLYFRQLITIQRFFRKYKLSNYFVEIIGVKFQLEIRIPLEILLREDRYSRGKINGLQTVNIIIYR